MTKTFITPRALLDGAAAKAAVEADAAWPFLGVRAFTMAEMSSAEGLSRLVSKAAFARAPEPEVHGVLAALARPRAAYCGFDLTRPILMGVINVTPDSFSDGGKFLAPDAAIAHGIALLEAGASIIDIGGESTRPGAAPVPAAAEMARVVPVITALANRGACVSIDTRHAVVMDAALSAGARLINDVTALTGDPQSLAVAARTQAHVILMHMQGEPQSMQQDPTYVWAPGDIFAYLEQRISVCVNAGIPPERIAVDPGIGFGKTDIHNAQLMDHLAMFHGLGCAVALGVSRKSFIGRIGGGTAPDARLPGSLAAAMYGVGQGAQILRVHDIAETYQALTVAARLTGGTA